ncbi:uncharacterized protein KLLA0_C09108g [Kluyveromyces lactis]|uniref:KLLA0C09108p n=1 Tax=Kluyveromyces lactis (strain ATCC 8585 / CBS 2359 / DSM 70799 / NBRC 1267 / NRRL Y-1140 / WM37) TaxID=284590 RepID=Q6CTY4_KLULA|nr:uncharacterized protein KLLA0_C09108g [Kluyveromyces lactis]CAH01456.1 KLLA0C09108p [Kluyveromyces lactis]|eukprot:XP_452605.1 uncharacterized protein KLLA0_C09108g [Kluyveromyces lactis]
MNIWIAASNGETELVEKFIKQGQTANDKDENGYTPIHAAAAYGHIDLLKKLVQEHNGDVNIKDSDNDTPLHHCEDATTARSLIEQLGADRELLNNEGKTCFQVWQETCDDNLDLLRYAEEVLGETIFNTSLGIDKEQLNQFKDNIRYTLENDPVDETDPESLERRKKLESIIQGENAEEELEKYIRDLIHNQFFSNNNDSSENNKRVK